MLFVPFCISQHDLIVNAIDLLGLRRNLTSNPSDGLLSHAVCHILLNGEIRVNWLVLFSAYLLPTYYRTTVDTCGLNVHIIGRSFVYILSITNLPLDLRGFARVLSVDIVRAYAYLLDAE